MVRFNEIGFKKTSLKRVGVVATVEKMIQNKFRWFGHVKRRPIDVVVQRVDKMEESRIRIGRGIPRKTKRESIRKDLEVDKLNTNIVSDRTL